MKINSYFQVSPAWYLLLSDMHINIEKVLAYAGLPADLFDHEVTQLTPSEYFKLWYGIERAAGNREVPLLLSEHLSVEAFDPLLFASICCPNLNSALKRIQQYKSLIGPLDLTVNIEERETFLSIACHVSNETMPMSLQLAETVFFTQLSRLATRDRVVPSGIIISELPTNLDAYQKYFGCVVKQGPTTGISFSALDAKRPFLTSNAGMWKFFENGLNKRLSIINLTTSTQERVKDVLVELLPIGESSINIISKKLNMSERTLQRRLYLESTSYKSILQSVRSQLAEHYLSKSQVSLSEISFLLGYQDVSSFIRAFTSWKGTTPSNFREMLY